MLAYCHHIDREERRMKQDADIRNIIDGIQSVRYIKLGRGGDDFDRYRNRGELRLGFGLQESGFFEAFCDRDWETLRRLFSTRNDSANYLGNVIGQLKKANEPYDAHCLWFTFEKGSLWWALSRVNSSWRPNDLSDGVVMELARNWSNLDLNGEASLGINNLSGALTKVSQYRGTVCGIASAQERYLKRRILGDYDEEAKAASDVRQRLLLALQPLIRKLTPQDFELLIALIFSKSGWQQVSVSGKTMKDIDLELILPSTGEKAVVQVKSSASEGLMRQCVQDMFEWNSGKVFWVCHTPNPTFDQRKVAQELAATDARAPIVWDIGEIADKVLTSGLVDWLIEKVR